MVGILISKNYKYKDAKLPSGAVASATQVTFQSDEVSRVENGSITIDDVVFSFSVYSHGIANKRSFSLGSVPEHIDGQAIVKEFIEFVENEIKGV